MGSTHVLVWSGRYDRLIFNSKHLGASDFGQNHTSRGSMSGHVSLYAVGMGYINDYDAILYQQLLILHVYLSFH
jgi:hypothetical protein